MRKTVAIASILVLAFATTAFAEGPDGQPPPGDPYAQQQQPAYDPAMQQQPQQGGQVQVVEQGGQVPPDQRPSRGLEYGAHIIVPVWLDPTLPLDPGIGIQGRVGWEFGNITTELNIGYMGNGFTLETADEDFSSTLTNVWIGAGVRFSFFNPSALVPFGGAGLALNFWGLAICVDDGLGGTVCDDSGEREATISFNVLGGVAWELTPEIALEFGVQINYTLPGDVFLNEEGEPQGYAFVSPFLGGTLYF